LKVLPSASCNVVTSCKLITSCKVVASCKLITSCKVVADWSSSSRRPGAAAPATKACGTADRLRA
jgi:hypothetical protein